MVILSSVRTLIVHLHYVMERRQVAFKDPIIHPPQLTNRYIPSGPSGIWLFHAIEYNLDNKRHSGVCTRSIQPKMWSEMNPIADIVPFHRLWVPLRG